MIHHHTSLYPIPDDCPIEGKPDAGCPYPFNGSILLELKKLQLTTKAHWEEVEILMADDAAAAIISARDKYLDAWLELHEDDMGGAAIGAGSDLKPVKYQDEAEVPSLGPDHQFDGKQMASWGAVEVTDWLASLGSLSAEEKTEVARKFKDIKMDEAHEDAVGPVSHDDFDGNDLTYVRASHLRTSAKFLKSEVVVSEAVTSKLIAERDAYRKQTEDQSSRPDKNGPTYYMNTPMWNWKHKHVKVMRLCY